MARPRRTPEGTVRLTVYVAPSTTHQLRTLAAAEGVTVGAWLDRRYHPAAAPIDDDFRVAFEGQG